MSFEGFFLFFAVVAILFNGAETHFLAILVEGHPRDISVKLFWNQPIGLGGDVVFCVFFYF